MVQEARESQYVDAYLAGNTELGYGRGYTVSTFLDYVLRGKAKDYASGYRRALQNALKRRVAQGRAIEGISRLGGIAYYPILSVSEIVNKLLSQQ